MIDLYPVAFHDSFGSIPRSIVPKGQLDDSFGSLMSDFGDSNSFLFDEDYQQTSNTINEDQGVGCTAHKHFPDKVNNAALPRIPRRQGSSRRLNATAKSSDDSSGSGPKSSRPIFRSDDSFRTLISDFGDSTCIIFEEEWMQPRNDDAPATDPLDKFKSDSATLMTHRWSAEPPLSSITTEPLPVSEVKVASTAIPRIPRRRASMNSDVIISLPSDPAKERKHQITDCMQKSATNLSPETGFKDKNTRTLCRSMPPRRPQRYVGQAA